MGEDTIEGSGIIIENVDPGPNGGGDELEKIEGCAEREMGWDSKSPGTAAMREIAQALRTSISTVGDGWTTICA